MNQTIDLTQGQIEQKIKQIKDIDQTEKNIIGMTGLSGNTLIQCLASVRAFAQTIEKETTVYSPLGLILSAIKNAVQPNISLLVSKKEASVYLAVVNILKQVKYLSEYSVDSVRALKATTEYSLQPNSIGIYSRQNKFLGLN